uniref:Ketoreductase domain-containing protein n=1 Tax=Globisporangium ultimum (strain ATCC 200006 / CBS 805.95 / DAOM BR144) TaxID=431595 RepID=K3WSA4_GLOUD
MAAKTVLITGSTRSIGLKLAELYIKRGWNVIGVARDLNRADQLKSLSPYKIVQLDASDEASIVDAAKQLEGEPIDLVINNAGIFDDLDLASVTKDEFMRAFEVNSVGPFLVTRALLPNLRLAAANSGSACVAQISSRLGSIGHNTSTHGGGIYSYRASKAAINMINSSLAVDLKSDSIVCVVLHPGYVATDLNGHQGTISTDTSVGGLVGVIDKLSIAETGKFFDYTGTELPW